MGKVYVGQTALRIRVTTGVSLAGAKEVKIVIKRPNGSRVTETATVEDPVTGIIYYDVTSATYLNEFGNYVVQAYVKFSDDRIAYGEEAILQVFTVSVI